MCISQKELKVLERFLQPKVVENEEEAVLDEYRRIGWIGSGGMKVSLIGNAVKVIPITVLTSLGRQFVQRALILRSPWRRFLYKLINIPAGG